MTVVSGKPSSTDALEQSSMVVMSNLHDPVVLASYANGTEGPGGELLQMHLSDLEQEPILLPPALNFKLPPSK